MGFRSDPCSSSCQSHVNRRMSELDMSKYPPGVEGAARVRSENGLEDGRTLPLALPTRPA